MSAFVLIPGQEKGWGIYESPPRRYDPCCAWRLLGDQVQHALLVLHLNAVAQTVEGIIDVVVLAIVSVVTDADDLHISAIDQALHDHAQTGPGAASKEGPSHVQTQRNAQLDWLNWEQPSEELPLEETAPLLLQLRLSDTSPPEHAVAVDDAPAHRSLGVRAEVRAQAADHGQQELFPRIFAVEELVVRVRRRADELGKLVVVDVDQLTVLRVEEPVGHVVLVDGIAHGAVKAATTHVVSSAFLARCRVSHQEGA